MTRFAGDVLLMDNPITVGAFNVGPGDFAVLTNATLTRNAAGDISANQAASLTGTYVYHLTGQLRQINALLSTTSTPQVDASGKNVGIGDAPVAKGVKITDLTLVHLVTGGALTSISVRLDRTVFVDNVANAVTPILAAGANGLATAARANPYVTKIAIADSFDVTDNDIVTLELSVVTPAAVTFRYYGCTVHCSYNLN